MSYASLLVTKVATLDILIRDLGSIGLRVISKGLRIVFTRDTNTNIRSCHKLR